MASIKLSPAHGVNPSLPVCFWCGEDKGDVLLLGKLKNDAKAPMRAVYDLDPCEKCAQQWNKAVVIFETTYDPSVSNSMPISKDDKGEWVYPTGGLVGITADAANRLIPGSNFKPGDKLCFEKAAFQKMMACVEGGSE